MAAYTGIQALKCLNVSEDVSRNLIESLIRAGLGTLFTFLMTTLGAATVFFFTRAPGEGKQRGMIGFAAGVMTAASIWSLLLPAVEQAEAEGRVPGWLPAGAGLLLGVVFLALLDEALRRLHPEGGQEGSALLMTAITLHNIPEGMAVGLAFALAGDGERLLAAATLALGIGIQNFPEGAAVALPLRQEGFSRLRAFVIGMLSGAVEPLFGVLVVLAAAGVYSAMPWLLSFAAGAMLYVVVEELVPQAHSRAGTAGFVGGFLAMMILDIALG
ncbi:MAG: ZIP family metal transporter [Oscillospiraceae bacterium]|nr:ZIP family metal transporter [Oscillospiraceae bacterium]